jgi:Transposase
MSAARYRERHTTSGAKSDSGDAHVLAEIVRLDRAHHRPVAGDSAEVEGLKLVARMHQSLIWDRTRHLQRLRQVLREYYPGLLAALAAAKLELGDPDAWELIQSAPDPDQAARLSRSKITAILRRTGGATPRPGPSRSRRCCASRRCGNRLRFRPPTPRSPPPRSNY